MGRWHVEDGCAGFVTILGVGYAANSMQVKTGADSLRKSTCCVYFEELESEKLFLEVKYVTDK